MSSEMHPTPSHWFDDPSTLLEELQREARSTRAPIEIAGYERLVELYRGGQGVVYRSVQLSTGRTVAIKVLLDGALASSANERRFEREVDLVASLRHPNIVSIYDSGVTSEGRRYLVMEFIDGAPLDQAVALAPSNAQQIQQIVSLVATAADAIQFAHQHGVMHRDLKPSNIRVDRQGAPRVLDFGLAKAIGEGMGDSRSAQTISQSGSFFGSLAWASPEQAEGRIHLIDVRTDVYSLGMILYFLLTGEFPYDVRGKIRQTLDNIVTSQPIPPRGRNSFVDADLQTIVLKAIAKDPDRRYQSALDFSEDLRRLQSGEPISARRDSTWYVLKRNIKRYRRLATAAVVFLVMSLVYAGTVSVLYRNARDAERVADDQAKLADKRAEQAAQHAAKAEAINTFLRTMLSSVDAENEGYQVRVADVLSGAADQLEDDNQTPPVIRASLYQTLGSSFQSLGRYADAEALLRNSVRLFEESDDDDAIALLASKLMLGCVLHELDRLDEAGEMFESIIAGVGVEGVATESVGDVDPVLAEKVRLGLSATTEFARLRYTQGQRDEAIALGDSNRKRQSAVLGPDHFDTLNTMNMLGGFLQEMGRFDEARQLLTDVREAYLDAHGPRHPKTLAAQSNIGSLHLQMGEYDTAEQIFSHVLAIQQEDIGDEHANTLTTLNNLADAYLELGRLQEAEAINRRVLRIARKVLGRENQSTLITQNNLARNLHDLGKLPEAEQHYREILEVYTRTRGEDHPATLLAMGNLSGVLQDTGDTDAAVALARRVVQGTRKNVGDESPQTLIAMNNLASQLRDLDQHQEAVEQYEEVIELANRALPVGHWMTCFFEGGMGKSLIALEKLDRAEQHLTHAFGCLSGTLGVEHRHTQTMAERLVELYELRQQPERAEEYRALLIEEPNE